MVSLSDLPLAPQPYPNTRPWVNLGSYVGNGWAAGSANFVIIGSIEGNLARLYMRTRRGTDAVITESLPEPFRPPSQRVFGAFCSAPGSIGVILESSGELRLYAPGQSMGALTDGTLSNLILETSYLRDAP